MRIKSESVYLTDNGAALCGAHLGDSARTTGRDISGQEILEVTPDLVKVAETETPGFIVKCEQCGRQPSRLYL